eukprot:145316-Pyramimonas_sp.AAC.1
MTSGVRPPEAASAPGSDWPGYWFRHLGLAPGVRCPQHLQQRVRRVADLGPGKPPERGGDVDHRGHLLVIGRLPQ